MSHVLTLVAAEGETLSRSSVELAEEVLLAIGASIGDAELLGPDAVEVMFEASMPELVEGRIRRALDGRRIDVLAGPVAGRRKKLLLADMDSTMIQIESLDELADALGIGKQVREITERSMRGELDFAGSLRTRVALLEGQPEDCLDLVLHKVAYTPGAETAVRTMVANGAHAALVSGGFTFTTDVVHRKLGFHEHHANQLLIDNGFLTGTVSEPILGPEAKLENLNRLLAEKGLDATEACCIGDGANDLQMIEAAGLGVAYRGKPIVRERARFQINRGDMTALLYFQGYHDYEFVS